MKRIKFACLEQTLHFMLKEDGVEHDAAVKAVHYEVQNFKDQLTHKRIKYKIIDESVQPDDSVILKLKKQYNGHDCGDYLEG